MRIVLVFLLTTKTLAVDGFLNFPLSVDNAVETFLDAIQDSQSDFMKFAVPGEQCNRECKSHDKKVCHFHFMIKFYQVMSGACGNCFLGNATACLNRKCVTADGIQRGILSINLQLPGPTLHVCKGDKVVVDVQNEAEGISTSVHFHGMRQINTAFMDGVPYLTQCPIPYGSTFRYAFNANDEGTHFYHSHSGHQKIDGVFGALIVREPIEKNPIRNVYDFDLPEHVILASDWMHQMAENQLPGMMRRSSLSASMLINGRGRFYNSSKDALTFAPWTVFHVQAGMRHRFRIINAAFNVCPFQFQVENHTISVMGTELSYIEPIEADTLHFLSGERFDIVIDASRPPGDYWIRVRELLPCWKEIEGFAILRYHEGDVGGMSSVDFNDRPIPAFKDEYPMTKVFNSLKPSVEHIALTATKALETDDDLLRSEPDHTFHLVFDTPAVPNHIMYAGRNPHNFIYVTSDFANQTSFVATVNNITFQFPSFPLLTEPDRIEESMFCDVHSINRRHCVKNSKDVICKCIHRVRARLNSVVEIIAFNTLDKIPHPLHLHGHKFLVLDTQTLNETREMSYDDFVHLNITKENAANPPFKDTCILPYPGYVRLRFRATNPGFWRFHCHYDWHMPIGMALIVQVGEIQAPGDFSTCHTFLQANFPELLAN